jgi:hypothetical protein
MCKDLFSDLVHMAVIGSLLGMAMRVVLNWIIDNDLKKRETGNDRT